MRAVFLSIVVLLLIAVPLPAEVVVPEPEALLPPVTSWSGASETLVVGRDDPWVTPAERSGLTDSGPKEPVIIAPSGLAGKRVVGYSDGSVMALRTEEFEELISETLFAPASDP